MLEELSSIQLDVEGIFREHIEVIQASQALIPKLKKVAIQISLRILGGATVFWCGNGGSAADAQHMAAELVGRFNKDRPGISSLALSTDGSVLTSVSNDYGYESVFARQLEALCQAKDVVICLSTSGNSPNILKAVELAKNKGAYVIGLTGHQGGKLAPIVDDCFIIPSTSTPRIQEAHSLLGHTLCEWIENAIVTASISK